MNRSVLLAAAALTLPACELMTAATIADDEPTVSLAPPPGPIVEGEPAAVVGHPDPLSLLESDDPALAANKRLVFDVWRGILAEDYIQHNPNVPTGREAIKPYLAARDDLPIEASLRAPLVASVAEGDLVVQAVMFEHPDPRHQGGTYTSTGFDMFRIANGQLAEHWDAATKAAPPSER